MKRMSQNFPNGGAMDTHFANMRSLIQVQLTLSLSRHVYTTRVRPPLFLSDPGLGAFRADAAERGLHSLLLLLPLVPAGL